MSSTRKRSKKPSKQPPETPESAMVRVMLADPSGPDSYHAVRQKAGYWLVLCDRCQRWHRTEGKAS